MQKARGNYCINFPEDNDEMMMTVEVKNSGGKIVPRSDLRVGTANTRSSKEKLKRRIATWNVRSLGVCGKLENLKLEMDRYKIDVLGISEIKWTGLGDFWSGDYRIIFNGDENKIAGVGIIVNKDFGHKIKSIIYFNERIIGIKIETKQTDTFIIQIYMPTSGHKDEEIEELYEQISEVIEMAKEKDNLIILGDWNAVVGERTEPGVTGKFGLGTRNQRGDRLIEFCKERDMIITNTLFSQPKRRRYTWTMPGGGNRYQLDYILVKKRYRNQVKQSKSYPGADINSDHNLVIMETRLCLKKSTRNQETKKKWCVEKLKQEGTRKQFFEEVNRIIRIKPTEPTEKLDNYENTWKSFKEAITNTADKILGKTKNIPIKPWISTRLVELIETRRKYKNRKTEEDRREYKKYRNMVNREAKRAKEKWLENKCSEIENCLVRGLSDKAYKIIKQFFGTYKSGAKVLRGRDGNIVLEDREKILVWKEYIEELYKIGNTDKRHRPPEVENGNYDSIGPAIMTEEIELAIKELKRNKAPGIDNLNGELLIALEGTGKEALCNIIINTYETGELPEDFEKCVMIPIPKKQKAEKCEEYRTLSLISHASKILTKIVHKRIEKKIEDILTEDQFGFRKNRGTREAILCLRLIIEKMFRINKPIYIAFVDLEKAFDNVRWEKLFHIMDKIGIDFKDKRLIHKLYINEKAVIKGEYDTYEEAKVQKGVRQGCNLSPALFNLYIEEALKDLREEDVGGIKIGGMLVQMLRFADDIAMIADSEKNLERMLQKMNNTLKKFSMNINKTKTKILVGSRQQVDTNIIMDGIKLENVNSYTYLGSRVTSDGKSATDIRCRIAQAKQAFFKKKKLLTTNAININIRKTLVKTLIWSVALYGAESWTVLKADRRKIEAFETWCWRRVLKIPWTDRVTNEEVYKRINEKRAIWTTIVERRKKWIGHLIRNNSWITTIIEGKIEGKPGRGRPRQAYMKQIMLDIRRESYIELKRVAMNREEWKNISSFNQSTD